MNDRVRILVTGFGPFPGAPFNPTMKLVERLVVLRRPAFDDVELVSHIFHVPYATVDRELPLILKKHKPDALLSFGLADRTTHLRIETRARNAITTIFRFAAKADTRSRSKESARQFGADFALRQIRRFSTGPIQTACVHTLTR